MFQLRDAGIGRATAIYTPGMPAWNPAPGVSVSTLVQMKIRKVWSLYRFRSNILTTLVFSIALAGPVAGQGVSQDKSAHQGSIPDKAVNEIVGDSDIHRQAGTTSSDGQKVLAAIDKTVESTSAVRKLSAAKRVDIVVLADASRAKSAPPDKIERKLKDHENEIATLRQEVEANALLFHAVDSKRIMTSDILAVEFPDPETVIVYAAGKPPG